MRPLSLGKIEVFPLADESLGVRSMALGVATPDVTVLFDAGVSLAPKRFGLPPHPLEFAAAKGARERITDFARRSDIVTVSHYHLDHYTPSFTSYYEWSSSELFERTYAGKLVLVKKPDATVSFNQRRRAHALLGDLEGVGARVVEADGLRLVWGRTFIEALGPFPHGSERPMGKVLAFIVEYGSERVLFAPDVQGPADPAAAEAIAALRPTLLIVGGPPLYLEGRKVQKELVDRGLESLSLLSKLSKLVLSHHSLRCEGWRERMAERGVSAATYAGLLGLEEQLLEARRRALYRERPPPQEFLRWLREPKEGRGPPPLPE